MYSNRCANKCKGTQLPGSQEVARGRLAWICTAPLRTVQASGVLYYFHYSLRSCLSQDDEDLREYSVDIRLTRRSDLSFFTLSEGN